MKIIEKINLIYNSMSGTLCSMKDEIKKLNELKEDNADLEKTIDSMLKDMEQFMTKYEYLEDINCMDIYDYELDYLEKLIEE